MRLIIRMKNSIKRKQYLCIVPHAIGIGEDSAEVPKAGLLGTACPFIEGGTSAEVPVFVGVVFDIVMHGGLLRHGMDKGEEK